MVDNENKTPPNNSNSAQDPSRRKFIKNTGIATGGVVGGALLGGLIGNSYKSDDTSTTKDETSERQYDESRMFFTRFEDFKVLQQATERIFPEDDNGPGAIKLGVPYFIDKQLAGEFGSNKKDYMKAPSKEIEDVTTYQTLMNRGEVFIEGLRKLNAESQNRNDTKFYDLEEADQDALLIDLEEGKIKLEAVHSNTFFRLLRQMTIEGAYSDPLYGGNRNMEGWKMREHPGIRASYIDLIESEDFQDLDPISLKDYQQ